MILKCVALCRCSGKVAQEKVVGLYTCRSSHKEAERFRKCFHFSFSVSVSALNPS